MAAINVRWRVAPQDALIPNLLAYEQRVLTAVASVADMVAGEMQDAAKRDARWTDRTGNARSGLFGDIEQVSANLVRVYLSHGASIDYGQWLELANAGEYQVILPTIQGHIGRVQELLNQIFR